MKWAASSRLSKLESITYAWVRPFFFVLKPVPDVQKTAKPDRLSSKLQALLEFSLRIRICFKHSALTVVYFTAMFSLLGRSAWQQEYPMYSTRMNDFLGACQFYGGKVEGVDLSTLVQRRFMWCWSVSVLQNVSPITLALLKNRQPDLQRKRQRNVLLGVPYYNRDGKSQ